MRTSAGPLSLGLEAEEPASVDQQLPSGDLDPPGDARGVRGFKNTDRQDNRQEGPISMAASQYLAWERTLSA